MKFGQSVLPLWSSNDNTKSLFILLKLEPIKLFKSRFWGNVFAVDQYLFQLTIRLKLDFNILVLSGDCRVTTETQNFVSVIANVVSLSPLQMTYFVDQFNIRLVSQLTSSISRALQKLLNFFYISICIHYTIKKKQKQKTRRSPGVKLLLDKENCYFNIFCTFSIVITYKSKFLDSNYFKSVMGLFGLSLQYCHKSRDVLE